MLDRLTQFFGPDFWTEHATAIQYGKLLEDEPIERLYAKHALEALRKATNSDVRALSGMSDEQICRALEAQVGVNFQPEDEQLWLAIAIDYRTEAQNFLSNSQG